MRQRRGEGESLERLIPEVRCLVREAESCEGWQDELDVFMALVVPWAIEAYHDQPELQHVPRFD